MSPKSVLIALAALLATSSSLNAEGSKAEESEESNAAQPLLNNWGISRLRQSNVRSPRALDSVERSCYRQLGTLSP
jgi:hypothetical protein